ncbi:MAG: hypothetical protein IKB22_04950 [Lentisphaeria bacterium]|nr:hypothetical protein [Lentisphaeria bacterium]
MSSFFFGFFGIVWIVAGIVSFGWPFVVTGIGMIAAAFAIKRTSRKVGRGDYGTPVPLSPKHYVPPTARLVSGIVVSVFGIVWMIAIFRMGGGWFAAFGLMFILAGLVQMHGAFRK